MEGGCQNLVRIGKSSGLGTAPLGAKKKVDVHHMIILIFFSLFRLYINPMEGAGSLAFVKRQPFREGSTPRSREMSGLPEVGPPTTTGTSVSFSQ